jgi:transposase
MEACGGANFWAREFLRYGHDVKLISPQFVKPYVKTNKNDANDAAAICEAVSRPSMRFVPIKTLEQQDIQSIHRIRSRLVKEKTALMNSVRGLLHEYGIAIPQGVSSLKKKLVELMDTEITATTSFFCRDLYDELLIKEEKIKLYDEKINEIFKAHDVCKRIEKVPGVGKQTATIIFTALGNGIEFKNGREFAAYLGLVPKQASTGGKTRLLGISKRGDKYIRSLLVHGARSVVIRCENKEDARSKWIQNLMNKKGMNKAAVAVANKNARIIWAIVKKKTVYKTKEELLAA